MSAQAPGEEPITSELSHHPYNLPAPLTTFIGRTAERSQLLRLLDTNRLVTLTGMAGIGKTRLGLQLAYDSSASFQDGLYYIQLAGITDVYRVISAIIHAIDAQTIHSYGLSTPFDNLIEFLRHKQTLLVLNNFEQVGAAAPDVQTLLERCPFLKILVTSRVAVHIYGEAVFPVPPLTLPTLADTPDIQTLATCDAVALFVARACAVQPDFTLTPANADAVVTICHQVEGLPLALELVAARMRILTPQQIAANLASQPVNPTVRRALEWSYMLLDSDAQHVLRCLGGFADSFHFAALAAIVPDIPSSPDLEDVLATLISSSLVNQTPSAGNELRYGLRESVRTFAQERLGQGADQERIRKNHAGYYGAVVEDAGSHVLSKAQQQWFDTLDREKANIRLALEWAEQNDSALLARCCSILWRFWYTRCYYDDGLVWLQKAWTLTSTIEPTMRAQVANGAGALAFALGQHDRAEHFYHESLALWQQNGDTRRVAGVLSNLGIIAGNKNAYDRAQRYFQESLALYRRCHDAWGIAGALHNLGSALLYQGAVSTAEETFRECLVLHEKSGDTQSIASTYIALGQVASAQNDFPTARDFFRRSLSLNRDLRNTWNISYILYEMVIVAVADTQFTRAAHLLGIADKLFDTIHATASVRDANRRAEARAAVQSALPPTVFAEAYAFGQVMTPETAVDFDPSAELKKGSDPKLVTATQLHAASPRAIRIDAHTGDIYIGKATLQLRGQQRRFFCFLYEHLGTVCTLPAIKEAVWMGDPPETIPDESVHQIVRHIRTKITPLLHTGDARSVITHNPALHGYMMPGEFQNGT